MPDYFDELNDSQRAAVEWCESPLLVIAGAGSGKTRVLTYKIAYLIQNKGYMPWNILALTFTNKAANEMKERIGNLVGIDTARYLNMGTFHSVFSRILRVEANNLGYEHNFTIYDESDSKSLIKNIIKELGLDEKLYKPTTVYSRISMAKNNLLFPEEYALKRNLIERDNEQRMSAFATIYSAYCGRCKMANAMDFDDLLTNTYVLLNESEDLRHKYADRFKYILVDEYQDTNMVQQRIVGLLSREHGNVCAVGDDAQSIYAFRGARIDNILDFRQQFIGARLFKLERNYRSTQRIVQAANSLISHNERQIRKEAYSENDEGEKLILKPSYSDREEAIIVCNEIKRIKREDDCEYSNFAILYRTNSQSRSFEEAMLKLNIPYRICGGLGFYQRKEIKDVLAYFRVVVNPDDEEAFKRIINYPKRGIGDTTIRKIVGIASAKGASLWKVVCELEWYGLMVSKATLAKIDVFRQQICGFMERAVTTDAYELGVAIVKEFGISADIYQDKSPENVSRQENLEELLSSIQEFVKSQKEEGRGESVWLTDFLQEISLQTDLDSDGNAEGSKVSLMTVHGAKGLEFSTVFVVGLEDNIFPSIMSHDSKRAIEEERRLLYVAITRAEKHCILTYAKSRYRYGQMEMSEPSRFLRDIDPKLLRVDDAKDMFMRSITYDNQHRSSFSNRDRWQNSHPVASQFKADLKPRMAIHRMDKTTDRVFSSAFKQRLSALHDNFDVQKKSESFADIKENSVIEHDRFGIGTVVHIEGVGENAKATVHFKNVGVKQLLLKFARFKVIG